MLSLYKQVLANRIIDSTTIADFNTELRAIERNYGISPISEMSENDCNRLEYQFVATYPKTLAKIYECYDKVLGLNIMDITLGDTPLALESMRSNIHARSILMSILNMSSLYGVSANLIYANQSAKHFLSRYVIIDELRPSICCVIV